MAFDFPNNPTTGTVYVYGGQSYTFTGSVWMLTDGGIAPPEPYVRIKGDTMTGVLILHGAPTVPKEAATKAYVDSAVTGISLGSYVAKAGDTMTGVLHINKTTVGSAVCQIIGELNGTARWSIVLGSTLAESGSNAGSNFAVQRYTDAGAMAANPALEIRRSDGEIVAGCALGANPGISNTTAGIQLAPLGLLRVSHASAPPLELNINANANIAQFHRSGTVCGSIAVTTTTTTYATSSDVRLKEDFKTFDAGVIIDRIDVYDFKWKKTGERSCGVSAQDAAKTFPASVVHDEAEDWWGVDYSKYVPLLLQEIKALRVRVAELENNPR